jgi:predicted RNA binding protein YcfA (HicA-like mRNA interferase family)
MTSAEVCRALKRSGWAFQRWGKGGHAIWSGPEGRRTIVPTHGHQVDRNMVAFVRLEKRRLEQQKHRRH